MHITRTFHPIGQGGFFTETHEFSADEKFTIVYDCGVAQNRKRANSVVRHPDLKDMDIDILFISHFDYDHVCKLVVLLEHVGHIKNVVMPLLHDEEKILLTNLFRLSGFNILRLINNPSRLFGNTTKIFRVAGIDNENVVDGAADELPVSLDTLSPAIPLRSGIRIGIPFNSAQPGHDWIFTPYNHESSAHRQLLDTELSAQGFNVHKLRTDPKYTLDKAIKKRRELKRIYNMLPGGINLNSMLVYSGPEFNHSKLRLRSSVQHSFEIFCQHSLACPVNTYCHPDVLWPDCFHTFISPSNIYFCCCVYEDEFRGIFNAPGCVYTGDTDLNTLDVHDVFKNVWKNVGTLQIPHHGAAPCFASAVLDYQKMICPIAVGSHFHKTYGHPAISVINTIIQKGCIPVFVTENNTAFVQTIN